MNILCIDCPYTKELEAMGHKVLAPDFPPGVIYLPGILQMNGFNPDLVIQHERLGARVLMGGLEFMPCPSVFVSVDSHLNLFWHKYYGRLFDVVLSSHISFFNALDKDERLPNIQRFAPTGHFRRFKSFDRRSHDLSFAGILTEHRPGRAAMVNLLHSTSNLYSPDKLIPHDEMIELFMDTRMVPNEAIAQEVNFRLFEGASCGSLVISQNIGEDQNVHFEPGLEFETYEHGLELTDKIRFYQKHPGVAEKIGLAAWRRVQAHHLPARRAEQLVSLASAMRRRAEGAEAKMYFWLTLAQLARHGTHPMPPEWFLGHEQELPDAGLVAAMKLRLLMESSHPGNPVFSPEHGNTFKGEAAEMIQRMLSKRQHEDSLDCNLAGAMVSLALERPIWARSFWRRQIASIRNNGTGAMYVDEPARLETAYENYLAWAKLLMAEGRNAQIGFKFPRGAGMLPGSAFECLAVARDVAGECDSWLTEIHKVCARVPGFSFWDMGFLAELSLKYKDKWRYQLEYGYSALLNYRVEAGLFELEEARGMAKRQDELDSYNTLLEGLPSSGYILSALYRD